MSLLTVIASEKECPTEGEIPSMGPPLLLESKSVQRSNPSEIREKGWFDIYPYEEIKSLKGQ